MLKLVLSFGILWTAVAHPPSCYSNHLDPGNPNSLAYYQSLVDYLDATSAPSPGLGKLEPISANDLSSDAPINLDEDIQLLHVSALLSFVSLRFDEEDGNPYHDTRGRERNRYGITAATLLAAHHFNNGNGEVVREIDGINTRCPVRIAVKFHDAESNRRSAVDTLTSDILSANGNGRSATTAVFGELYSSTTIPTATLTGVYGLTQVCPSCTTTELDDTQQYPLFGRILPSDAGTARAIISFAQQKNAEANRDDLRFLGVLYKNDAFGTAFYLALKESDFYWVFSSEFDGGIGDEEVKTGSLNVIGSHFSSLEEIDQAVATLAKTGFRVFVGIFYTSQYEAVFEAAYKYGIAGPGYTWILTDGFGPDYFNEKKFPADSPLAIASEGIGVFMAQGGQTTKEANTGYDRIIKAWRKGTEKTVDYMNCVGHPRSNSLNSSLYYQAEGDYFSQDGEPPKIVFFYDSIIALGLAACSLLEKDPEMVISGEELTPAFVQQKFGGSSGFVNIDPQTHSRTANSAFFVAYNAQGTTDEEGNTTFSIDIVSHTLPSSEEDSVITWVNVPGKQYRFSDGSTAFPHSLPEIGDFEMNHLSTAIRVLFLFFAAVIFGLSIFFAGWTYHHRNKRVVRASQPPFMYLICIGTFLMAISIIALSIDDSVATQRGCNIACMMSPWFVSIGFVFSFSSLFGKEWRINKIFHNPSMKRMKVEARDVVAPFFILLFLNALVLSLWSALSPLTWQRYYVGRIDKFGRELESLGTCSGDSSLDWAPYVGVLLAINGAMVILASFQAYQARHISVEFSESKYVATILVAILQALAIGIPIIVIVSENPTASFVVKSGLVFLICIVILGAIFIPKMIFYRESVAEEKKKEARLREKLVRSKRAQAQESNGIDSGSDPLPNRRSSLKDSSRVRASSGVLGMKVLYNPNCLETNRDALMKKIKDLESEVEQLKSTDDDDDDNTSELLDWDWLNRPSQERAVKIATQTNESDIIVV